MRRRSVLFGVAVSALVTACACNGAGQTAPPAPARAADSNELGALEAPDRAVWQQPERVMDTLNIADSARVADVGAGSGWFAAYLARRVGPNGVVYAEDIRPPMIESIQRRMKAEGLTNVQTILGAADDPRLPANLHAALLVDMYPQLSDPVTFLKRIAASLGPGGRIGVVDFKNDGAGGPGPPIAERVAPEVVIRDATSAGLTLARQERFLLYQYLLVFTKSGG